MLYVDEKELLDFITNYMNEKRKERMSYEIDSVPNHNLFQQESGAKYFIEELLKHLYGINENGYVRLINDNGSYKIQIVTGSY